MESDGSSEFELYTRGVLEKGYSAEKKGKSL